MSCCQDPVNLGCYCSCDTVTLTTLTEYAPNEVYIEYNFNGASRKQLITDVSETGQPIIDTSTFNEDYNYTFGVYDRATGTLLGCYKIKITPCAGDIFDIPALPPVEDFLNSEIVFIDDTCAGETVVRFLVDIADPQLVAIIDGTIINFSFAATIPGVTMTLFSADPNLVVISPSQIQIISAAGITSLSLIVKVSNCDANTITGVVTSFDNLAPGWGNGTHTPDTININA